MTHPYTPPPSWEPQVGDTLRGRVEGYTIGVHEWGRSPFATVLEDPTGNPVRVWLCHVGLLAEFKRQRPLPGETIQVCRLPDRGDGPHRYRVEVDREGPPTPCKAGEDGLPF